MWLNIAALRASCPAAVGTLTGSGIAQMRLGLTRAEAHRVGRYRKVGYGFERCCLTGASIRFKYPAAKLLGTLSTAQRSNPSLLAGRPTRRPDLADCRYPACRLNR